MHRLFFVLLIGFTVKAHAQLNTTYTNNGTQNNNINLVPTADSTIITPLKAFEQDNKLQEQPLQLRKGKAMAVPAEKKQRIVTEEERSEDKEGVFKLDDLESVDSPAAPARMQQQFQTNQLNSTHQYNRRSASGYEQMNMDASVGYYKTRDPNAFETHFYTWLAGHYNTDLYPDLKAAAQQNPENTDVKKQLAAYQIITNNPLQAVALIQELVSRGMISAGQLAYANDLLVSGDTGSIVVTHGFDDLFAAYYVQQTNHVRPDVQLLSLDFMQSAAYRSGWMNRGLALPGSETIDTAYLAELCELNPEQTLQLSMTLPKAYFTGIKDRLYPVGLTFRYSELPVDNYDSNYRLWSSAMNLKLVRQSSNDSGDNWCTNYLPMLVTLRKQLELQNRQEEVQELNKEILGIGIRTNTTNQVKKYTK